MKLLNEILSVTRVEPTTQKRPSRWFDVCPECRQHPCICVGVNNEKEQQTQLSGCSACGGSGMDEENEELCARCDGTGHVSGDDEEYRHRDPCPGCSGSGEQDGEVCPSCFGSGNERDDYEDEEEDGLGKYDQKGMAGGVPGFDDENDVPGNPSTEPGLNDQSDATLDNPGGDADTAEPQEAEDPDRQGLIRKVKGAHLVYKRTTEDGTYEELWVYNTNNDVKSSFETRKNIIAGTDIPVGKSESEDGSQTYEIWTSGNVEMVMIKGLPN